MKYLVTDPCYIMSDEQWDEYGEKYGWNTDNWPVPIKVKGGTITKISTTTNGDGSMKFGDQVVGVDSGTVCLAEMNDSFSDWKGVTTKDYGDARDFYSQVQLI